MILAVAVLAFQQRRPDTPLELFPTTVGDLALSSTSSTRLLRLSFDPCMDRLRADRLLIPSFVYSRPSSSLVTWVWILEPVD